MTTETRQSDVFRKMVSNAAPVPEPAALPDKILKHFSERFDTELKDQIFHKVDAIVTDIGSKIFDDFITHSPKNLPVSLFKDQHGKVFGALRYGSTIPSFLAKLYFGAALSGDLSATQSDCTAAEFGLIGEFSNLFIPVIKGESWVTEISAETLSKDELDISLFGDSSVVCATFNIGAENFTSTVEIAILQSLILPETQPTQTPEKKSASPSLMSTKIQADIQLVACKSSLNDVKALRVGDQFVVSRSPVLDAVLKVRGRRVLEGQIGKVGQSYSLKVSDVSSANEKNYATELASAHKLIDMDRIYTEDG